MIMLSPLIDDLDTARVYLKNAITQLENSYESNGKEYKNILKQLKQLKKSIKSEINMLEDLEGML